MIEPVGCPLPQKANLLPAGRIRRIASEEIIPANREPPDEIAAHHATAPSSLARASITWKHSSGSTSGPPRERGNHNWVSPA